MPGFASAEDASPSLEQLVVEMAHTPAEHAAIAEHYRARASEARAAAARYGSGKLGTRGGSVHCKKLAEQNTAMAVDFEDLAKLHDAEALEAR